MLQFENFLDMVFPIAKRPWKTATKLEFLANGKKLEVSPDVFHVCLTENTNEPEARQAKETETQVLCLDAYILLR